MPLLLSVICGDWRGSAVGAVIGSVRQGYRYCRSDGDSDDKEMSGLVFIDTDQGGADTPVAPLRPKNKRK